MKKEEDIPKVELYSDGAAEPNPGKGGYGIILKYKGYKKEFYQGFEFTTNNRMELMGIIVGLEKLKKFSEISIYTDSKYVVDSIEKGWAKKWKENNWLQEKQKEAKNSDLWEKLLHLLSKHKTRFNWIKGHNGHVENERCDQLATFGMSQEILMPDYGYIETSSPKRLQSAKQDMTEKTKITQVGDQCRDCNTPVEKRIPKHKKLKPEQSYYFEWYLYCINCKKMYMVESAKKEIKQTI